MACWVEHLWSSLGLGPMFLANKSPQRAFLKGVILMTDEKQVASTENPKLLLFVHSHPVMINSCRCSILANASIAAYLSSLSSSAAFKRQLEAVLPPWFSRPPGSKKKNNNDKNPVDLVQLRLVMEKQFRRRFSIYAPSASH